MSGIKMNVKIKGKGPALFFEVQHSVGRTYEVSRLEPDCLYVSSVWSSSGPGNDAKLEWLVIDGSRVLDGSGALRDYLIRNRNYYPRAAKVANGEYDGMSVINLPYIASGFGKLNEHYHGGVQHGPDPSMGNIHSRTKVMGKFLSRLDPNNLPKHAPGECFLINEYGEVCGTERIGEGVSTKFGP